MFLVMSLASVYINIQSDRDHWMRTVTMVSHVIAFFMAWVFIVVEILNYLKGV